MLVIGSEEFDILSPGPDYSFETRDINTKFIESDNNLESILTSNMPDAIVTFGDEAKYVYLMSAPFNVRKRWINYPADFDKSLVGTSVMNSIYANWTLKRDAKMPLISVVTPTYNSGERILRAYHSLRSQNYDNWEWVLYDDSDDNGQTFKKLTELAKKDHRLQVYKGHRHVGKIGNSKHRAFGLARGEYLVEFDHDDELTHDALSRIHLAFTEFPDAGFAYSDWTEPLGNGLFQNYGPTWGLGYGTDYDDIYNGNRYFVHRAPNINPYTIRHIVSAPNHFRAWRRSVYHEIGGHNPEIPIADDFEICIRTFLATRMIHIPKLCYIQHMDGKNTHPKVINTIQRSVRYLRVFYDTRIHARFEELGIPDTVWVEDAQSSNIMMDKPDVEGKANYTATVT